MLNPFPELLTYGLLAPFLIRLFLGFYYFWKSTDALKTLYWKNDTAPLPQTQDLTRSAEHHPAAHKTWIDHIVSWVMCVGSILVVAGLYTQVGAIALLCVSLRHIYIEKEKRVLYFALGVMSLSLVFSGAGFLAFDIPL